MLICKNIVCIIHILKNSECNLYEDRQCTSFITRKVYKNKMTAHRRCVSWVNYLFYWSWPCAWVFFLKVDAIYIFYVLEASDTRVMSMSFYVNKPLTPVKTVVSRFFFNLHTLWNNRTAPWLWENGENKD